MVDSGVLHQRGSHGNGLPKQATGLELDKGVDFFKVEKPLGQVEHSWKDPTEHLMVSAPQVVTLHSESVGDECVCMEHTDCIVRMYYVCEIRVVIHCLGLFPQDNTLRYLLRNSHMYKQ